MNINQMFGDLFENKTMYWFLFFLTWGMCDFWSRDWPSPSKAMAHDSGVQ
jgi:hypothetical protein